MSHRFQHLSKGRIAKRGEMNKTEAKYAAELEERKLAGEIVAYWFEPFSLRLSSPEGGQPARYTPDFLVLMPDGLTVVEDVKGSGLDDKAAIVRIKCAAEQYPLWKFRIVKAKRVKDGGGWTIKEV